MPTKKLEDNIWPLKLSEAGDTWLYPGDPTFSGTVDITGTLEIGGVALTATAAELNQAADNSANVETVTTTNVIDASESGKTFFLSLAGGFTSTLPAPAAGLRFKFIVKTAPTTAYIIATNAGANIMIGEINELEVDTTEDGPYDDNADAFNFVENLAAVGDFVEFISDGTSWYYHGQTNLDGAVTTSTT